MNVSRGILIACVLFTACSGLRVHSDWDPEVDFSQYETFVLLENPEASRNRLIETRIITALVEKLEASGFRQVDSLDDADLAIGHQVVTEQRRSYQTVYSGWRSTGMRHSRASWGRSSEMATTTTRDYTVGALVIAVFRTSDSELVWEGSGSRTIRPASSPEQSERRIRDAVQQIMRDFPPGA